MKLGGKPKSTDFVDALIAEGEHVAPVEAPLVQKVAPDCRALRTARRSSRA